MVLFTEAAEQNAKRGSEDKAQAKKKAIEGRMETREKSKPEIFDMIK